MSAALHNSFAHNGISETGFTARYTKKLWHLCVYFCIWSLFAGVIYLFLFSEVLFKIPMMTEFMTMIAENKIPFLIFAGLCIALITIDVLLVALVIISGRPALKIDPEGIHGFTGGVWRSIPWNRLESVTCGAIRMTFSRAPKNGFHAYIRRVSAARGGSGLGHYEIIVPVNRVDRSEREIYDEIERYRPDLLSAHI